MKIPQLTACAILLLGVAGCGRSVTPADAASPDPSRTGGPSAATLDVALGQRIAESLEDPFVNPYREVADLGPKDRQPGDFVVYRFSGSYRSNPLTLTQRVVDKRPGMLVIDVTIEESDRKDELRLRLRQLPGQPDELISVARLDNGVQRPFGTEAYEALMAKTMPPVVSNESVVGTAAGTVDVGGTQLACQRTAYRIFTGNATATMTTLESHTFAWGDLGGDVVTEDGTVLYRAQVVDYGTTLSDPIPLERPASVIAAFEDDDYAPDYSTSDVYE